MNKKIKVLIAKPGLDGHESGAKLIARALKDAGMEVIYTGPRQTSENIVYTALEEDVDIIGLSILSGSHKEFCQEILSILSTQNMETPIIVGGVIPTQDIEILKNMGIKEVFIPGSSISAIIDYIKKIASWVKEKGKTIWLIKNLLLKIFS